MDKIDYIILGFLRGIMILMMVHLFFGEHWWEMVLGLMFLIMYALTHGDLEDGR